MLTHDEVKQAYYRVFPNSGISVSKGCLSEGVYCKAILAMNKDECSHGYTINDPMQYSFNINGDVYKDNGPGLYIHPDEGSNLVYGRAKLRGKTIKNITIEKLTKRFEQVKQLVIDNKDNFIDLKFNINDKI